MAKPFFALLLALAIGASVRGVAADDVVVRPVDDGRALVNPGMGWTMHYYSNTEKYGIYVASGDSLSWFPGCSVVYLRLPWAHLEPEEGKYNWSAIDTPAQQWIERGGQVAFRITCSETMKEATPSWVAKAGAKTIRWNWRTGPAPDGKYWECVPDDPVFLEKLGNFLAALAARYDGRRELAFIDVGSLGIWGEGHTARTIRLTPEETQRIARIHADLHLRHFKKTPVVVNDDFTCPKGKNESPFMDYAISKGMGWRDDSIMVDGPKTGSRYWYHDGQARAFAETGPVVLETGHYHVIKERGNYSAETLLESIESHRASYMSIHGDPRVFLDENREAVRKANLRLGYRFQAVEIAYPRLVSADPDPERNRPFKVRFSFANAGVARCLRPAYPCLTLKNARGGIVAVLADGEFDLSALPAAGKGEKPKTVSHESEFALGRWKRPVVPDGDYDVWLSVGEADGTPVFELPYGDCDGRRRYRIGRMRVGAGGADADVNAFVDMFWGSGNSDSRESEGMARGWNWLKAQSGNTHPGAVTPFGWVSACAYSGNYSSGYGRYGCCGGGRAPIVDERPMAWGFTHFHHSGTGYIHFFYNFFRFTPFAPGADTSVLSRLEGEVAEPGYYAGTLADYGASFELAARPFAACHRYKFPGGRGAIRIDAKQCGLMNRCGRMRKSYGEKVSSCTVRETLPGAWDGVARIYGLDLHFSVRAKAKIASASCKDGVIEFEAEGDGAETAIGFSLNSPVEAAARADEAAADGFDAARRDASAAWTAALSRIRATFADEADRRVFYSALYHSLVKPVDAGTGFLDFTTLWDIYRTQIPLALSTQPQIARRLLLSMLDDTDRLGYFPIQRLMRAQNGRDNGQAAALSVYVLADGFFRGALTKDDYPRLKSAFNAQFAATDIKRARSPTYALDFAGACRAAAFVAETCGDAASAADWKGRAGVWRGSYDPATGYLLHGENATYYEGDYHTYSFRAHSGMAERVRLAGGVKKFEGMLDEFFCVGYKPERWDPRSDRVARNGRFQGLNNESDMDAPFTYLWCGRPDRTAEVVDLVRRCRFGEGVGGCPGNNDSGGTSSWYVWACLGLYPFTGTPYYLLGSPSVERAEVDFAKGTLEISVVRESSKSIYPAGYVFNGREFREPWLKVSDVEGGGKLVFRLVDSPAGPAAIPDWLD